MRGLTLAGTTGAIVAAFQHMSLAEVTALVVTPFLMMILAVSFLG